jgi:hypothetical protein
VVSIGGQIMKGYSDGDLQSYIDAAGYPKQGRLVGYNWPPPRRSRRPPRRLPPTPQQPSAPAPAAPAAPQPKSGIQF